jgi:cytochrome P450
VDFRPNLGDGLLYEHHTTSLVFSDPPYHSRVRKLLAPAFTPRALMALQPRIEALVDRLLDRAAARGGLDLIADFAAAVPIQLVGDMLGVSESERAPLREWSLAILGALEPVLTVEQLERGNRAVDEFKAYLRDLVGRRGRAPDRDEGEILSKLTAGTAHGPGDAASEERLSERELLHNCIFILNAGHETTTNLIGNGVDLLLRHPAALRELRADPALIGTPVEEFLRLESSNQLGNRRAARPPRWAVSRCPPAPTCTSASGPLTGTRPTSSRPADVRRQPNRHRLRRRHPPCRYVAGPHGGPGGDRAVGGIRDDRADGAVCAAVVPGFAGSQLPRAIRP